MRYAIETTHAVPVEKTALYLVSTTTLLLCSDCHERLGTYMSERERAILEACHSCKAHTLHSGPVQAGPMPSEPFN